MHNQKMRKLLCPQKLPNHLPHPLPLKKVMVHPLVRKKATCHQLGLQNFYLSAS